MAVTYNEETGEITLNTPVEYIVINAGYVHRILQMKKTALASFIEEYDVISIEGTDYDSPTDEGGYEDCKWTSEDAMDVMEEFNKIKEEKGLDVSEIVVYRTTDEPCFTLDDLLNKLNNYMDGLDHLEHCALCDATHVDSRKIFGKFAVFTVDSESG